MDEQQLSQLQNATLINQQMQGTKNLRPYEQETIQYLRELTTIDKGVPTHVKTMLWAFDNKVHQLTNLTEEMVRKLINEADLILDYVDLYTPRCYKDSMWAVNLKQARMNFESAIWRSYEGFERKRQSTTTTEGKMELTPVQQKRRLKL